jgi:rhodanese-related sulfurtransferase
MSTLSLSDVQYIAREDLAAQIKRADGIPPHTAVIDVRDADHVGGHILGSTWVPSSTLDYKTPELVRDLKDKDVVVFHCVLSQQRGPSAALAYLREKARVEGDAATKQKVLVLSGGFEKWQEVYGEDETLTKGWERDVWQFGT